MAERHAGRERRALRIPVPVLLASLGSAFVLLAVTACGGGDQSSEVKGVAWQWGGVMEGGDTRGLTPIPSPASYLLRLDEDGSLVGRADCKSLGGTYSLSGKKLTLEMKEPSKRSCGPDSLSDRYIELLGKVATYDVYANGSLALGLGEDAGTMYFYAGSR